MKKIILSFLLFAGITLSTNAQLTRADIEALFTEIGTTPEKIDKIYVYNTMNYFTDGTSKLAYSEYNKTNGNSVTLADRGIKISYKPAGVLTSVYLIPYISIITIDIGKDYMSISLRM